MIPMPTTAMTSSTSSSSGGGSGGGAPEQLERAELVLYKPVTSGLFVKRGGKQGAPIKFQFNPDTVVLSKGMDPEQDAYSAFQGETDDGMPFAAELGERGVQRLFVGGLATDYCVKASVLDALKEGFEVVVLEDAMRPVDVKPGDGDRALGEMTAAGARRARLDSVGV